MRLAIVKFSSSWSTRRSGGRSGGDGGRPDPRRRTNAEVRGSWRRATQVIDARGTSDPGLVEGHGDLLGLGDTKRQLDPTMASTSDDTVTRGGGGAAMPRGTWIIGHAGIRRSGNGPPCRSWRGTRFTLAQRVDEHPVLLAMPADTLVRQRCRAATRGSRPRRAPGRRPDRARRERAATGLLRESAQDLVERAHACARAGMTRAQREADRASSSCSRWPTRCRRGDVVERRWGELRADRRVPEAGDRAEAADAAVLHGARGVARSHRRLLDATR